MPALDLRSIREHLGLTQTEFAALLGYSPRAVQSCEQGWRHPSPAMEKMALLLYMASCQGSHFGDLACWDLINCPPANRDRCIAYTTRQGHLCWFLTGNLSCAQKPLHDWEEKRRSCFRCAFFQKLMQGATPMTRDAPALPEPEAGHVSAEREREAVHARA